MGAVRLATADLDRMRDFYRDAIGLTELGPDDGVTRLGAGDQRIVELVSEPSAQPRPFGTSGLFHLAILVPSRADLARALQRVADAGWRLPPAALIPRYPVDDRACRHHRGYSNGRGVLEPIP